MKRIVLYIVYSVSLALTGCATKLVVHSVDPNSNKFNGIRVRSAVSYIITKEITTENCRPKRVEEIVHLPVGEPYDINFKPALFAKTEFTVSFSDNGVFKQVSLNATPQTVETIKALGELAEKVVPLVPMVKVDCGAVTGVKIIGVRRLKLPK